MVVSHESPLAGPRATLNFMRLHKQRIGAALPQPPITTANYDAKYLPFSYQIAPAAMFQFALPNPLFKFAQARPQFE